MQDITPIEPENCLALPGLLVSSRKRLFQIASETLAEVRGGLSADYIYHQLLKREKLGSTALGHGVAIPHCRVNGCPEAIGCIATLEEPVEFTIPDNQSIDIVFFLVVPQEATQAHLQLLATLGALFSSSKKRAQIREARDSETLRGIILANIPQ